VIIGGGIKNTKYGHRFTQDRRNPLVARITSRFSRLHPAIRFVVLFLVSLLVLSIVFSVASAVFNPQMLSFMALTAHLVGGVTNLFGMDVSVQDRYINAPRLAVEIIEECTGLYEIIIFIAAVLAYPATRREKTIGVAGGIVVLYALNIVRMVFLMMVGNARPDWFDFFHVYFWQASLILMITSVWLLWIVKVVRNDTRRPAVHS